MSVSITALYAGLLALLFIALAARISLLRRKHHVGIGSGGNQELALAVRVHANTAEHVPLALILLLIAELQGLTGWSLHLAGSAFFLGRVLHAIGLGRSPGLSTGRFLGTALTWTVIIGLGGTLIVHSVFA